MEEKRYFWSWIWVHSGMEMPLKQTKQKTRFGWKMITFFSGMLSLPCKQDIQIDISWSRAQNGRAPCLAKDSHKHYNSSGEPQQRSSPPQNVGLIHILQASHLLEKLTTTRLPAQKSALLQHLIAQPWLGPPLPKRFITEQGRHCSEVL